MLRQSLAASALAALALLAGGTADEAHACDSWWANHNGSRMKITQCGGALTISYARPRSGIRKQGVGSGTLLFDGTIRGNRINGSAAVFRRGCGSAWYPVSGSMNRAGRITLYGRAPVRNANCRVRRMRNDTLRFN